MTNKEKYAFVENSLVQRYKERGYLLEDEVIDCCVDHDLDLVEIDAVCDRLLKRNIVFREVKSDRIDSDRDVDDDIYDRSHFDYDAFLDQVELEYPSCKNLIGEIRTILPPQHKEWKTLIAEAQNGNIYAKDRLIQMYLRTIMKRAYDFSQTYYCDFEECFQNAVVGFINAIYKYDVTSPESFVRYYPLWLMQSMNRHYSFNGAVIRYPVHYKEKIMSLMNRIVESDFNLDEVAKNDEYIIQRFAEEGSYYGVYKALREQFALEYKRQYCELICESFDYNHVIPYLPLLDDASADESFEEEVIRLALKEKLRLIVHEALKAKECDVIVKRYGLDDGVNRTLEEVGVMYNVTRERVRQIEKKALEKLKRHIKRDMFE